MQEKANVLTTPDAIANLEGNVERLHELIDSLTTSLHTFLLPEQGNKELACTAAVAPTMSPITGRVVNITDSVRACCELIDKLISRTAL